MRCSPLFTIPLAATLILPGCPVPYDEEDEFDAWMLSYESFGVGVDARSNLEVTSVRHFLSPSGEHVSVSWEFGSADWDTVTGVADGEKYFGYADRVDLLDVRYRVDQRSEHLFLADDRLILSDLALDDSQVLADSLPALVDAALLVDDVILLEDDGEQCSLRYLNVGSSVDLPRAGCDRPLLVDDAAARIWIPTPDGILQIVDGEMTTLAHTADLIDFDPTLGILYAYSFDDAIVDALVQEDGVWSVLWSVDTGSNEPRAMANIEGGLVLLANTMDGSRIEVLDALQGTSLGGLTTGTRLVRLAGSDESQVFAVVGDAAEFQVLELRAPADEVPST